MKKILLLICVLLSTVHLIQALKKTISCERVEKVTWSRKLGDIQSCLMPGRTKIDSEEFTILSTGEPTNLSILGLSFYSNKQISFLPVQVDVTFPKLVGYSAGSCSIKTISKTNFKNLRNLKDLSLRMNQIETIENDTFEDLIALEVLWLEENRIQRMNRAVFKGLNLLEDVNLNENTCISKRYGSANAVASLSREVTRKCGLEDIFMTLQKVIVQHTDQKGQVELLNGEKAAKTELLVENAKLQAKLETTEAYKQRFEDQIAAITSIHFDFEVTLNESCNSQNIILIEAEEETRETFQKAVNDANTQLQAMRMKIVALEATLNATAESKLHFENHIKMISTLHSKLEAQLNLTCQEKTKDLTETVESKLKEISELLDEKIQLQAEVNEKNLKIKTLEATLRELNYDFK